MPNETVLKSVRCGCGVSLIDSEGKVPRRRVMKFGEGGKAYIGCPHCHADTVIGLVSCPPDEDPAAARKSHRAKIVVYFPGVKK